MRYKGIKIIKSPESSRILLKGTTGKIMNQKGRFLGYVLGPLVKVGLVLMKNVLTTLAKGVLIPLQVCI